MFGLKEDEWRDLLLSVNVHRKNRRISPARAGRYIIKALEQTNINVLAEALGFNELSTLRKIIKVGSLPTNIASLVDWGTRRGSLSMSTAAELSRLKTPDLIETAFVEAVKYDFSRDEARQVVQIFSRSKQSIELCIQSVLKTRPKIVRSHLVIGSILSDKAKEIVASSDSGQIKRKVEMSMARSFPDVTIQALRFNDERFSMMLSEDNANIFRKKLKGKTIEVFLTDTLESFSR